MWKTCHANSSRYYLPDRGQSELFGPSALAHHYLDGAWQAGDLAVSFHCCYEQRVMDVADEQDKYVDFPAFLGGSDQKAPSSRRHGMKPSVAQDDDGQLVHRSAS